MGALLWDILLVAGGMVFMGILAGLFIYHGRKMRSLGRADILNELQEDVDSNSELSDKFEEAQKDIESSKMRGRNSLPNFYAIKKIQTTTIVGRQYDIVLSFEIVQFLIMLLMQGWDISIAEVEKDILETIDEHKVEFPPGTNTIVVRRIQLHADHTGTYYLEPMSNPALKSIIS